MIKSLVRSIIPNSHPQVSLLRIYADSVEWLPLVAWDVQILAITPKGQTHPNEHAEVIPLTIEDLCSECIELIVLDTGHAYQPGTRSWPSTAEAIEECQRELCEIRDRVTR